MVDSDACSLSSTTNLQSCPGQSITINDNLIWVPYMAADDFLSERCVTAGYQSAEDFTIECVEGAISVDSSACESVGDSCIPTDLVVPLVQGSSTVHIPGLHHDESTSFSCSLVDSSYSNIFTVTCSNSELSLDTSACESFLPDPTSSPTRVPSLTPSTDTPTTAPTNSDEPTRAPQTLAPTKTPSKSPTLSCTPKIHMIDIDDIAYAYYVPSTEERPVTVSCAYFDPKYSGEVTFECGFKADVACDVVSGVPCAAQLLHVENSRIWVTSMMDGENFKRHCNSINSATNADYSLTCNSGTIEADTSNCHEEEVHCPAEEIQINALTPWLSEPFKIYAPNMVQDESVLYSCALINPTHLDTFTISCTISGFQTNVTACGVQILYPSENPTRLPTLVPSVSSPSSGPITSYPSTMPSGAPSMPTLSPVIIPECEAQVQMVPIEHNYMVPYYIPDFTDNPLTVRCISLDPNYEGEITFTCGEPVRSMCVPVSKQSCPSQRISVNDIYIWVAAMTNGQSLRRDCKSLNHGTFTETEFVMTCNLGVIEIDDSACIMDPVLLVDCAAEEIAINALTPWLTKPFKVFAPNMIAGESESYSCDLIHPNHMGTFEILCTQSGFQKNLTECDVQVLYPSQVPTVIPSISPSISTPSSSPITSYPSVQPSVEPSQPTASPVIILDCDAQVQLVPVDEHYRVPHFVPSFVDEPVTINCISIDDRYIGEITFTCGEKVMSDCSIPDDSPCEAQLVTVNGINVWQSALAHGDSFTYACRGVNLGSSNNVLLTCENGQVQVDSSQCDLADFECASAEILVPFLNPIVEDEFRIFVPSLQLGERYLLSCDLIGESRDDEFFVECMEGAMLETNVTACGADVIYPTVTPTYVPSLTPISSTPSSRPSKAPSATEPTLAPLSQEPTNQPSASPLVIPNCDGEIRDLYIADQYYTFYIPSFRNETLAIDCSVLDSRLQGDLRFECGYEMVITCTVAPGIPCPAQFTAIQSKSVFVAGMNDGDSLSTSCVNFGYGSGNVQFNCVEGELLTDESSCKLESACEADMIPIGGIIGTAWIYVPYMNLDETMDLGCDLIDPTHQGIFTVSCTEKGFFANSTQCDVEVRNPSVHPTSVPTLAPTDPVPSPFPSAAPSISNPTFSPQISAPSTMPTGGPTIDIPCEGKATISIEEETYLFNLPEVIPGQTFFAPCAMLHAKYVGDFTVECINDQSVYDTSGCSTQLGYCEADLIWVNNKRLWISNMNNGDVYSERCRVVNYESELEFTISCADGGFEIDESKCSEMAQICEEETRYVDLVGGVGYVYSPTKIVGEEQTLGCDLFDSETTGTLIMSCEGTGLRLNATNCGRDNSEYIPSSSPTISPIYSPSTTPTAAPSLAPVARPSVDPSAAPSCSPSFSPSYSPLTEIEARCTHSVVNYRGNRIFVPFTPFEIPCSSVDGTLEGTALATCVRGEVSLSLDQCNPLSGEPCYEQVITVNGTNLYVPTMADGEVFEVGCPVVDLNYDNTFAIKCMGGTLEADISSCTKLKPKCEVGELMIENLTEPHMVYLPMLFVGEAEDYSCTLADKAYENLITVDCTDAGLDVDISECRLTTAAPSLTPTTFWPTVNNRPSWSPSVLPSCEPTIGPTISAPSQSPTVGPSSSPSTDPSVMPSASPSDLPSEIPTASPSVSPSTTPSVNPTVTPSVSPSNAPSGKPSGSPTVVPSCTPSVKPSTIPTVSPSVSPSVVPTPFPVISVPTTSPSVAPSTFPSTNPSQTPSVTPTTMPTRAPTKTGYTYPPTANIPSVSPSVVPTRAPTLEGYTYPPTTELPTRTPSVIPTRAPTPDGYTYNPTPAIPTTGPTHVPSELPSMSPTTEVPTLSPTNPTRAPTEHGYTYPPTANNPSVSPSVIPTRAPTPKGYTYPPTTELPTKSPSVIPTRAPTPNGYTYNPTPAIPTTGPTQAPSSDSPSFMPTLSPTNPTRTPSQVPTNQHPSCPPTSSHPSISPSYSPSSFPTSAAPSNSPSTLPTILPTMSDPTAKPSRRPSVTPSRSPSASPSIAPTSSEPSGSPSFRPSVIPSTKPSDVPTLAPSASDPSTSPSYAPSYIPTDVPSKSPTVSPSASDPSTKPTFFPSTTPTTSGPTKKPSLMPSAMHPTVSPTPNPSTSFPTRKPSQIPTTTKPSPIPTSTLPSSLPTSTSPSHSPTIEGSVAPTVTPVLKTLTFDGDFVKRVGANRDLFLTECSKELLASGITCTHVYAGSIKVEILGHPHEVEIKEVEIRLRGLTLPSFLPTLYLVSKEDTMDDGGDGSDSGSTIPFLDDEQSLSYAVLGAAFLMLCCCVCILCTVCYYNRRIATEKRKILNEVEMEMMIRRRQSSMSEQISQTNPHREAGAHDSRERAPSIPLAPMMQAITAFEKSHGSGNRKQPKRDPSKPPSAKSRRKSADKMPYIMESDYESEGGGAIEMGEMDYDDDSEGYGETGAGEAFYEDGFEFVIRRSQRSSRSRKKSKVKETPRGSQKRTPKGSVVSSKEWRSKSIQQKESRPSQKRGPVRPPVISRDSVGDAQGLYRSHESSSDDETPMLVPGSPVNVVKAPQKRGPQHGRWLNANNLSDDDGEGSSDFSMSPVSTGNAIDNVSPVIGNAFPPGSGADIDEVQAHGGELPFMGGAEAPDEDDSNEEVAPYFVQEVVSELFDEDQLFSA